MATTAAKKKVEPQANGANTRPTQKAEARLSTYVVLRRVEYDVPTEMRPAWAALTTPDGKERVFEAATRDAALSKAITKADGSVEDGIWKAVALSAWRGETEVATEMKPVVSRKRR